MKQRVSYALLDDRDESNSRPPISTVDYVRCEKSLKCMHACILDLIHRWLIPGLKLRISLVWTRSLCIEVAIEPLQPA